MDSKRLHQTSPGLDPTQSFLLRRSNRPKDQRLEKTKDPKAFIYSIKDYSRKSYIFTLTFTLTFYILYSKKFDLFHQNLVMTFQDFIC